MQSPLRVAHRESTNAADAFLLLTVDPRALASACVRLGLPAIHPVHGGFLLIPPGSAALPGAIRLRRLAGDLYVPADGELHPALLPEEMVGLTHSRGIVALPGGEFLAFDPANPWPVNRWLASPRIDRGDWQPFPSRPGRADRLTKIEGPPAPLLLDVLDEGAPPDASPLDGAEPPEDARPPSGSPGRRMIEKTRLGLGRTIAWLGRNLHVPGLAKLGGDLVRKAVENVPRLSEKILGAQEAALREVLRQLQSGDVEKGLKRAPIAVADPDSPGSVGTDANLGTRDPRYSLRDLLGSGGASSAWLGGGDVWLLLAVEYRRLAQEALRRGDHRRAAYLYGVLLRDPRSAANALMAGGLFRDAAVIFRDRLKDELAAADAFAQAGDFDEAIRLYEKNQAHLKAADLLRLLGDEERAQHNFLLAAEALLKEKRFSAAADLMTTKAGRRDLAMAYYRQGWESGTTEVVPCGQRLWDEHLSAEELEEARTLLDEAQKEFAPPRTGEANRFFNHAVKMSQPLPQQDREDLADRVRMLFADHLRSRTSDSTRSTDSVSELFGQGNHWPAPLTRDANHACRKPVLRASTPEAKPYMPVRIAEGTVRAAILSRESNDLILATTMSVVVWRKDSGQVIPIFRSDGREILGISADPSAQVVYVLYAERDTIRVRRYAVHSATMQSCTGEWSQPIETDEGGWYIQPTAWLGKDGVSVTIGASGNRLTLAGPHLVERRAFPFLETGPEPILLVHIDDTNAWDWTDGSAHRLSGLGAGGCRSHWTPGIPEGSTLACVSLDWTTICAEVLEVVGVDRTGVVYWSRFDTNDSDTSATCTATHADRFAAACLTSPGNIAAVTMQNEVQCFRVIGNSLQLRKPQYQFDIPARAVAIAARPKELLVILQEGSVIRVPNA